MPQRTLGDSVDHCLGGETALAADEPRAEPQLQDVQSFVVGVEGDLARRAHPVLRAHQRLGGEVDAGEVGQESAHGVVGDQVAARIVSGSELSRMPPGGPLVSPLQRLLM